MGKRIRCLDAVKCFDHFMSPLQHIVFVMLCLLWTTVSFAVDIPTVYGKITRQYDAGSKKHIVYIQDAHYSFDAQKNIAHIICSIIPFLNNTGNPFIGIEGAIGEYDLKKLREYPIKEAKYKVGEQFVVDGKFICPELASIISDNDFTLFGLENKELLEKNFNAFYQISLKQSEIISCFKTVDNYIALMKDNIFNDKLKQFDKQACNFDKQSISLSGFVQFLYPTIERLNINETQYKYLYRYKKLIAMKQAIDFTHIDIELKSIVDELSKKTQSIKILKRRYLDYIITSSNRETFLDFIISFASKEHFSLKRYKNVLILADYYRANTEIDISSLLNDIENINKVIRMRLAVNDNEKRLLAIADKFALLRRLLTIKATNKDIAMYRHDTKGYSLSTIISDMKEISSHIKQLYHNFPNIAIGDGLFALADTFYTTVEKRDNILLGNLLKRMDETKQDTGVLVAGGYHSSTIEKMLEQRKISFITVCPRIEDGSAKVAYMNRMMGKIIPLDPIFTSHLQISGLTVSLQALNKLGYGNVVDQAFLQMNQESLKILTRQSADFIAEELLASKNIDISTIQIKDIPQENRNAWLIGQALKQIATEIY